MKKAEARPKLRDSVCKQLGVLGVAAMTHTWFEEEDEVLSCVVLGLP